PLCVARTSKKALKDLLHPARKELDEAASSAKGDRLMQQLAQHLGIPRVQVCVGYNHLKWAQAGR
ncbi:MAG: hypothetical protein ACRD3W_23560, partial [Terriglobales bacterium]